MRSRDARAAWISDAGPSLTSGSGESVREVEEVAPIVSAHVDSALSMEEDSVAGTPTASAAASAMTSVPAVSAVSAELSAPRVGCLVSRVAPRFPLSTDASASAASAIPTVASLPGMDGIALEKGCTAWIGGVADEDSEGSPAAGPARGSGSTAGPAPAAAAAAAVIRVIVLGTVDGLRAASRAAAAAATSMGRGTAGVSSVGCPEGSVEDSAGGGTAGTGSAHGSIATIPSVASRPLKKERVP
jgi:hypothetical protein